jgi:hypothetical protein
MNELLTFKNERLFIGNNYNLPKFDAKLQFLFLEHAIDLFTPKQLLSEIKNKLKTETSLVYFNGKQLLSYFDKQNQNKFKKIYGDNYQLYILYCDPINEIDNFSWKNTNLIKQFFKQNKYCPAARFYDEKLSIIVLNANVISLIDNGNELEVQLDHELNHIFDRLSDKKYENINEKIQNECIAYFQKYDILTYDVNSIDFSIHMFNSSEFYEMLANLCNVISLYFNISNKYELYQKIMNMLTHEYIISNEFKQLIEPVQGAIVFGYICKKYSPERWNRVIKAVKTQLELTGITETLKICLNNLTENFKIFLGMYK